MVPSFSKCTEVSICELQLNDPTIEQVARPIGAPNGARHQSEDDNDGLAAGSDERATEMGTVVAPVVEVLNRSGIFRGGGLLRSSSSGF